MRQIKFRGKTSYEKWLYGYYVEVEYCDDEGRRVCIKVDGCPPTPVIPDTVGQFTGLPDKVGREIYEHDIVTWTDSEGNQRIDVVKWMRGGLCLCNANYTVGSYGGLEVIGNTIDNPELLKGGKE